MKPSREAGGCGEGNDSGFTLVELLVVLVILPAIIGAVVAGIIAVLNVSLSTNSRLTGSENAQVSAAYFTQDVQGAQYVYAPTTAPYASSPSPCGSGGTLVLALYRSTGSYFSAGYWLQTTGGKTILMRYNCNASNTVLSNVLVSDDVNPTSVAVSIAPKYYLTDAQNGWTPTSAYTTSTSATSLPAATIPVASTQGFTTGAIIVLTSSGYQSITCTGRTATSFTGCTGGQPTYVIPPSASVTQPSNVSGIQLSVYQPSSTNTYRLTSVPRGWSSTGNGLTSGTNPLDAPALLTLGSGVTVQGGVNSTLTVNGVIDVNGGTLSCTGAPAVTAYGYVATNGTTAIGCGSGGPTTTAPALADPLQNFVPTYGCPALPSCGSSTPFPYLPRNPALRSGSCMPGEYTVNLPCSTLEPGVYVLDAGLNLTGNATLSMAADAGTDGVLLYLPCNPPGRPSVCNESLSLGGGTSLSLTPLTATQAAQYLGTSALSELAIWQDKGDSSAMSFGGTPTGTVNCSTNPSSLACGTVYAPAAAVTFQGNAGAEFGRVIAASVSLAGSAPLTVTGQ